MAESLKVTVDGLVYFNVSAVGIGHLRKDLTLVFPDPEAKHKARAEELGCEWVELRIERGSHEPL